MKRTTLAALVGVGLVSSLLSAQGQVPGVNSTLNSVFNLVYDNSTMKPTYMASSPPITPVASTQDICSISGSATKTVKVRRIVISAVGAASPVTEPLVFIKRSTAYTAGAGTAIAQVPYDSVNSLTGSASNAGTVGMLEAWTSNPTSGTVVGAVLETLFFIGATAATGHEYRFDYGVLGSPIVLRGVAQNLGVNFAGNTISGAITCNFEWTEE